jgi:DNA-binding CsgD family transcriptional regulator
MKEHAFDGFTMTRLMFSTDHLKSAALSPRAEQTLKLLLAGHADKAIAGLLGISRHTVNHYTKIIYRHFDVHSRAALMARLLSEKDDDDR